MQAICSRNWKTPTQLDGSMWPLRNSPQTDTTSLSCNMSAATISSWTLSTVTLIKPVDNVNKTDWIWKRKIEKDKQSDRVTADLCIWTPTEPERPQFPLQGSAPPPCPPHSSPQRTKQKSRGCWPPARDDGPWRHECQPSARRHRSQCGAASCWSGPGWFWHSDPRPAELAQTPAWPSHRHHRHHHNCWTLTHRWRTWQRGQVCLNMGDNLLKLFLSIGCRRSLSLPQTTKHQRTTLHCCVMALHHLNGARIRKTSKIEDSRKFPDVTHCRRRGKCWQVTLLLQYCQQHLPLAARPASLKAAEPLLWALQSKTESWHIFTWTNFCRFTEKNVKSSPTEDTEVSTYWSLLMRMQCNFRCLAGCQSFARGSTVIVWKPWLSTPIIVCL